MSRSMFGDVTKRIGSIKFSCLSPEEIRNMSKVKVITPDTYDDEGRPYDRGLMDPRMGVVDPGSRCKTCGCKVDKCPGHFGSIELARPVIHVGFIKEIKMLLECTCQKCGRLLISDARIEEIKNSFAASDANGDGENQTDLVKKMIREKILKEASASTVCPCEDCVGDDGQPTAQVKIKLDKPTTFREVKTNNKLSPDVIRERLERIPDDVLRLLGMDPATCRPEWMILTVLAVPPVTVRPSITLDTGDRSEDDLTHKLVDVLRINERLRENRDSGAPQLIVEDLWELLQYHVTTYFDNQTSGIPQARHRSGRPLKTLTQRLKGKEGRFRSNLSGKRVNFSSRTVISPDPLLSINQVGVPVAAARELSVPIHINELNIETMRRLSKGGLNPVRIPSPADREMIARRGVRCVGFDEETGETDESLSEIFSTHEIEDAFNKTLEELGIEYHYVTGVNKYTDLQGRDFRINDNNYRGVAAKLEVGFTIERQLIDGDVVLFNRQPSLHRMSMMAHRVKIMEGKTFRFNLCVCPPYNADFDGDEMNLHVLQSEEARAEARILMQVQENILSPRYGGPIIGGIHDHITGIYFLTHGNPRFSKQEAMNILTKLDDIEIPEPMVDEDGKEYWTGRQLFSIVLPDDLNLTYKARICKGGKRGCEGGCKKENCPNDAYVVIRNGELVCGTIDVNGIGNSKGLILEHIARDYRSEKYDSFNNGIRENRAAKFINQVTRLALGSIMNHGFSTGIDDEDISEESKRQIAINNEEKVEKVDQLVQSYLNGTLAQRPGQSLKDTLEASAQEVLEEARMRTGEIAGNQLGMTNPAVIMAKIGARGNMLNLSQMAGCVGQQTVRGDRLDRGYRNRTLPHFKKKDLGAFARGFVANSYKSGLSPTEFFFHAMGGREGLVDTAVRTSRSGYMQRRLISALEDLKLTEDGSVRNTANTIIQFEYGEDGIDPTRSVHGESVDMSDLFTEVFGTEASKFVDFNVKEVGDDYASKENDDMELESDDEESDSESIEEYENESD